MNDISIRHRVKQTNTNSFVSKFLSYINFNSTLDTLNIYVTSNNISLSLKKRLSLFNANYVKPVSVILHTVVGITIIMFHIFVGVMLLTLIINNLKLIIISVYVIMSYMFNSLNNYNEILVIQSKFSIKSTPNVESNTPEHLKSTPNVENNISEHLKSIDLKFTELSHKIQNINMNNYAKKTLYKKDINDNGSFNFEGYHSNINVNNTVREIKNIHSEVNNVHSLEHQLQMIQAKIKTAYSHGDFDLYFSLCSYSSIIYMCLLYLLLPAVEKTLITKNYKTSSYIRITKVATYIKTKIIRRYIDENICNNLFTYVKPIQTTARAKLNKF